MFNRRSPVTTHVCWAVQKSWQSVGFGVQPLQPRKMQDFGACGQEHLSSGPEPPNWQGVLSASE